MEISFIIKSHERIFRKTVRNVSQFRQTIHYKYETFSSIYTHMYVSTSFGTKFPVHYGVRDTRNVAQRFNYANSLSRNVQRNSIQRDKMMFMHDSSTILELIRFHTMPAIRRADICPSAILYSRIILRIMKECQRGKQSGSVRCGGRNKSFRMI